MTDQISPSKSLSVWEKARYRFDNSLTRGVWIVILLTALALAMVVVLTAGILWLTRLGPADQAVPFPEAVWLALTRSLDAGTVGPDEGGWFRAAGITITLFGLLAVAVVIGLVTSAVERRVFELRRGRSTVAETGHTLVLGYSPMLPFVVSEILEATKDQRRNKRKAVVILTRRDTIEVEDIIKRARHQLDPALRRSEARRWNRVVVRRGTPSSVQDLAKVRPQDAAAVIILRPELTSGRQDAASSAAAPSHDDADAEVVKAALAVLKTRSGRLGGPIVAELSDEATATALKEATTREGASHSDVMCVLSTAVVAQIAAQTARAAGLGTVYTELLDFEGGEFHFYSVTGEEGFARVADSLFAFDTCTVVGVQPEGETAVLCPEFSKPLKAGDRLIVIAEDDTSIKLRTGTRPAIATDIGPSQAPSLDPQRYLLVGWNRVAPAMVAELDRQATPDSTLVVLTDPDIGETIEGFTVDTSNLVIRPVRGSTIDRKFLKSVMPADGPYDHIIVLCAHKAITPTVSDARTLLTLLHLRHLLVASGHGDRTNVVTEVMESEAVDIARVAQPDDFIVSQRLVSLLLAQLAIAPSLDPVFRDLFDTEGTQVYIEPIHRLQMEYGTVAFSSIIMAAAAKGHFAIGVQASTALSSGAAPAPIHINPSKDSTFKLDDRSRVVLLTRQAL